jgi:uncharacterized protein YndB with AHSA1/START domain
MRSSDTADSLGRLDGAPREGPVGALQFPDLEALGHQAPPLHKPGARTLARDRWERLVTAIDLPDSPDGVWKALVDAGALKSWLARCRGSLEDTGRDCVLDFEDGEFFLCRPRLVQAPERLEYVWRWLGIGKPTLVSWSLGAVDGGTRLTVTEEATNPPWDWQTWNGGGWPGILDQLAAYLRTGMEWRWPWRRMGPYAQVELVVPFYEAWDRLLSTSGLRYWLQVMRGEFAPGRDLTLLMGDASGMVEMAVREVVQPGEVAPSFLPSAAFALRRPVWGTELGGRLWLEPAGWGRCLLQVVLFNWENLPPGLQLPERKILTNFWAGAVNRASLLCGGGPTRAEPHGWS